MNNTIKLPLKGMVIAQKYGLQNDGNAVKQLYNDAYGSALNIINISNNMLSFSVIPERGMDIGEILLKAEKISWERNKKYLLHPDNLDLSDDNGTGWVRGFYPAVASIGPELFGTPGEGYTLHGTGSYSNADPDSVNIISDGEKICIEGTIPVRANDGKPIFEKKKALKSLYGSANLLIKETTKNMSEKIQVIDDGLHIQLAGAYTSDGGRYVLPVQVSRMLLRDSAPNEEDPLYINPLKDGRQPLRCYQYIPEPVKGIEKIPEIGAFLPELENPMGITVEMIVNLARDTAAYVARPLNCFPRSLVAKEINENAMFALEPCRTRPNRMSQKITDGEAVFLQPGEETTTFCLIGITKDIKVIDILENAIESSLMRT